MIVLLRVCRKSDLSLPLLLQLREKPPFPAVVGLPDVPASRLQQGSSKHQRSMAQQT
jgi:hypothetical protein